MEPSIKPREQATSIPSIAEYAPSDVRLMLKCSACERKGKYDVGRIFLGLKTESEGAAESNPGREVSFSGLFRCKHCKAGGPWIIPPTTYSTILFWSIAATMGMEEIVPVRYGKMAMFDGTIVQCGTQAEAYLKQKIAESTDDAFLWSRLGNLYDNAGEQKQARAAYERAIELDPGEVESHYHLGLESLEKGDQSKAAEHFQQIVKHAINAPRRNPELLEGIVRQSLSILFDLYCETDGAIPFPPEFPQPADLDPQDPNEPQVITFMDMDLGSQEAWDMLTSVCLTGRVPETVMQRERRRAKRAWKSNPDPELAALIDRWEPVALTSTRTHRNDPCPCGSGTKYKRCCGQ